VGNPEGSPEAVSDRRRGVVGGRTVPAACALGDETDPSRARRHDHRWIREFFAQIVALPTVSQPLHRA
jgi:hypothetical protein